MEQTAEKNVSKQRFLEQRIGDPVFLMCIRYSYRGTVVDVSGDSVILKDAFAILSTGPLNGKTVSNEEALPGLNLITLDSLEGIFPYLSFIMPK